MQVFILLHAILDHGSNDGKLKLFLPRCMQKQNIVTLRENIQFNKCIFKQTYL